MIDLPEASLGQILDITMGAGSAVSPDGELVAIASRRGPTQAVVVDLRSRSIRGVLRYAPGSPRLAFSLDGQRIYATGMNNASVLSGWRLPADEMPRTPRWWLVGLFSNSGASYLLWNPVTGRSEVHRLDGTQIASGVHRFPLSTRLVGEGPRVALITPDDSAAIFDVETDRFTWQQACRVCRDIAVSNDGSRFAQVGADGLEVWDTRTGKRLFHETQRVRPNTTETSLSGDGRRLAWSFVDQLFVRELDSERELARPIDGVCRNLNFSPDGSRLMTATTRSVTLREAATGRELWSVANELADNVISQWSPDGRTLSLRHGFSATEVVDPKSGERLAWFQTLPRVVSPVMSELYSHDVRLKALAAEKTWDIRPVPPPDETPAAESLARTLKRTGLALRGVELIAAP